MVRLPDAPSGGGRRVTSLPDAESLGFNPLLTPKIIGRSGTKGSLKILGDVRETELEFSDIVVACQYKSKTYDLGVKFSSGNYSRLLERFGKNPSKWKGTVDVEVMTSEKFRKDFIAIKD